MIVAGYMHGKRDCQPLIIPFHNVNGSILNIPLHIWNPKESIKTFNEKLRFNDF